MATVANELLIHEPRLLQRKLPNNPYDQQHSASGSRMSIEVAHDPTLLNRQHSTEQQLPSDIAATVIHTHHGRSQTSFPLYSCGDDNFWLGCWEDDLKCSAIADGASSFASGAANRCIDLTSANIDDDDNDIDHDRRYKSSVQYHDHAVDLAPSVGGGASQTSNQPTREQVSIISYNSQPTSKKARKTLRVGKRRVRFSKIQFKSPDKPLTEEERKHYFWSEAEIRSFKMERRLLLTKYKRKYNFNGAAFWSETEDSIRGLEDHTADFVGLPSTHLIRREHAKKVLREVHEQRKSGEIDMERLAEVSIRSSGNSYLRALDRAQEDSLAVQSFDLYQCPIEAPLLWDTEKDGSVFSDS